MTIEESVSLVSSAPAGEPATTCPAAKALILVIEDDPRSARMLAASLTSEGYRVIVANDEANVRELVQQEPPDLIICDVLLPGTDGIELTRCFRAAPATQWVPVLLVTSLDDRKVLARGLEAGADDILIKPIHTLELRTRVANLLRKKVLAEELNARGESLPHLATGQAGPDGQLDARIANSLESTVLLVEDSDAECRLLANQLAGMECRIVTASNVQTALEVLERETIDLAILDLLLPDCSGYSLIEHIRINPRHAKTPILIVSAMAESHDRVKALELGADDFIVKGFDPREYQARVGRLLRLKRAMDQLTVDYDQVLRQAITDSLTGLYTHGFLKDTIGRQFECARRYGWPLSLLFLDIDHFKSINDKHGHAVGDEILRILGDTIRQLIRRADVGVRYGGEEFVVLLPHTDRAAAERLAERIRREVAQRRYVHPSLDQTIAMTVSIGVSCFPDDALDATMLLQHADHAMYKAKRLGRNRVTAFSAPEQCQSEQAVVLIADDDERNLRLLESYLHAENYKVLRAKDGQEAIDVARQERPDLILLDGMMPRLTGFEACCRIREDRELKLIPVILVTALNSREDKLRGVEAGADDFVTKPIDKVALFTRMRALLRNKRSTDLLEDAETVIFALARAVEARDPSTGGHVERVSRYAAELGRAAGLPAQQVDGLRRAGFVHDIGKIVIPDNVLLKPGKLTAEERRLMEGHVEAGYELLRPMRTFAESLPAVRFHHERLDGSGYPFGLKDSQIPLIAQILAVVDVYDALTSNRVYREALTPAEALGILQAEASGGLHDRNLVDLFAKVITNSSDTIVRES